jgi:transmembrane sensor
MTKPNDAGRDVQTQAKAWLLHLRSGKVTAEELEEFRRWCAEHPQMARTLREMWSTLRGVGALVAQEEANADLSPVGIAGRAHALRPGRRALIGFAVAAGASWLALRPPLQLWPAVSDFAADYHTGTGQQRQVPLSERVTVEMNTQTRINILPTQAGAAARHGIELLAGEAEILAATPSVDRTPLSPVVVVAGRGRLTARIARFDVRRTDAQVCVTCVSGSIAFEHPQQSLTLLANQQLIYNDRDLRVVSQVDPSAVMAWRRGVLVFNGVPFAQVIDEINRYRPGKVILRNTALAANSVQAQSPIARLDDLIDTLSRVYGARTMKLPGDIVVLT